MFFDARAAKALAPGKHIVIQGCPGLRLVATDTRKTWTYRYRSPVDNGLRQMKLGYWPAMPAAVAAGKWQQLRERRESGVDPQLAKKQERAAVTQRAGVYTVGKMVEDYWHGYLEVNRQPKGARLIGLRLVASLEAWASAPAESTSRSVVFEVVESLIDTPVLARSVRTEMAAAWRFAVEAGRVPDSLPNWWGEKTSHRLRSKGAMRDGKRKGTAKRVLSGAEIRALMLEDLGLFSAQVQAFLTLQIWTCTRGAELCQMRRSQITEEADGWWWTIPKSEMKGRNVEAAFDLRVPLEGSARETVARLLETVPADVPWLFPSRSRAGELKGQTQAYMQSKVHYMQPYSKSRPDHVRPRLQVSHWSPHDLRRTGRTMLAAMGCPHEVGEAILGHVVRGVAGVYNLHQYDAERRHWLGRLSSQLQALVS